MRTWLCWWRSSAVSCPAIVSFFTVACDAGDLMVVRGADLLSVFDRPQRKAIQSPSLRPIKTLPPRFRGGPMAISVLDPRATGRVPASIPQGLVHHEGLPSLIISSTRSLMPECQQKGFTLFLPALLEELAIMPCS
jgi:hypothetical protein